jgi:glycosyltransferase involved in cell wall biosynthesis
VIRVGFAPLYNIEGPSSRYRVYQFLPALSQLGFECNYLEAPEKNPWKRLKYLPKLLHLAANHQMLYVQKRVFPNWVLSILLQINPNLVFDMDDAIYLQSERKHQVDSMLKAAKIVVTGNAFLCDYAARFNANVVVIPSVIDTAIYEPPKGARHPGENRIVIGWTGTDPNRGDLKPLKPIFDWLYEQFSESVVLRTVGRRPLEMETKLEVEFIPWTLEGGRRALQNFDIGIMPLEDSEWNRGKCGFKLIQYMAAGAPAVASPVGVNQDIIKEGENGYLARNLEDWKEKIKILITNERLRRQMGIHGRKTVEERYSLKWALPHLSRVLEQAAAPG